MNDNLPRPHVNWVGPDSTIETAGPTRSAPQAVRAGRDAHVRTDREVHVTIGSSYPNVVERFVKVLRDVLLIVAILFGLWFGMAVLSAVHSFGDRFGSTTTVCSVNPDLC